MFDSLGLRLVLVTAVLPMVTIAAAGLLIRSVNAQTFDEPTFSVGGGIPWNVAARRGSVLYSGGSVAPGEQSAFTAPLPEACFEPFTAAATNAPVGVRVLDASAVAVVYSGGRQGGDFIVAADAAFIPAFERRQEDTLDSLNLKVAAVIGSAGLVCGLVGFVASQRIIRPVTALTGAARRMEAGDLEQRVDYEGRDELGQLSHAFNSMAAGLHRNETLRQVMTSDIAHELRTPLTNIAGFVDMLADGLVEPDARVLATLQEETQLLVGLVDDLEQLSLGDAGQLKLGLVETDAGLLVSRAVEAMAPRATEFAILLAAATPFEPVPLTADPSRIEQVLRNLIENALRHTPEGGGVTAAVDHSPDAIRIVVEDSGAGIDAEHLPNIFERFYRADPSRTRATGGSGLGLAIVRQIVEAHGGSVTAENRIEGGARFIVSLPRSGGVTR